MIFSGDYWPKEYFHQGYWSPETSRIGFELLVNPSATYNLSGSDRFAVLVRSINGGLAGSAPYSSLIGEAVSVGLKRHNQNRNISGHNRSNINGNPSSGAKLTGYASRRKLA